ncbi:DNA methyltransferase [Burkholderia cepacia]|uniref:Methyltransferase n=2 Tax=Burkholderia cepacia TaxID=292 RepID=A0A103Z648_BURCE|nr:DNA methyltransferase [Burkholderia cepacia]
MPIDDLFTTEDDSLGELVSGYDPFFKSKKGLILHADSLEVMKSIPDNSINLVFTSPPYALHFKKEYGNVDKQDYVAWFTEFAKEIKRILTDDGSFVLNIGGSWNKGEPSRSVYHFKLAVALVEEVGFTLAQETFWYNPAKMPVPAQWVTIKRVRVKDSVEYVWWFSKTAHPKADNRRVLRPYSKDMLRLAAKGVKTTVRPSGHNINESFDKVHNGGSIPPNMVDDDTPTDMLKMGNNSANDVYTKKCKEAGIKIHPARFPAQLPEFFIKMLTDEEDIVLDPFGGSMTTGAVAEALNRRWIGIDTVEEYLDGAVYRF